MTVDFSAIARWPNVPACYDWLSLDRRGNWRLQGERVTHSGLISFMNRQYGSDASGRWFVQNGPQQVFVRLECTPWIYSLTAQGLNTHTGQPCTADQCFTDAEGNIFIMTTLGIGLLDDRDLAAFIDTCETGTREPVDEERWTRLLSGEPEQIVWNGLSLQAIDVEQLPLRFNFQRRPRP